MIYTSHTLGSLESLKLKYFSSNSNLKRALQKTLLKKRLKYRHPITPKTSFCDKTIGSRELIFWTIPTKKCMNNLEFFQPNLRRSSGSHCPVWRGMTQQVSSPVFNQNGRSHKKKSEGERGNPQRRRRRKRRQHQCSG